MAAHYLESKSQTPQFMPSRPVGINLYAFFHALVSTWQTLFISFEESVPKLSTLPSEFFFTDIHDLAPVHGCSSRLYNALVAYIFRLALALTQWFSNLWVATSLVSNDPFSQGSPKTIRKHR